MIRVREQSENVVQMLLTDENCVYFLIEIWKIFIETKTGSLYALIMSSLGLLIDDKAVEILRIRI